MAPRRLCFLFLLALACIRFLLSGAVELSSVEAYITQLSEHLDIGYYGSGPGTAFTVWLGSHTLGFTELGVRWIGILAAFAGGMVLFELVRSLINAHIALWAVVFSNLLPVLLLDGFRISNGAIPVLFELATIYYVWTAIAQKQTGRWFLAGLFLGGGLYFSYSLILFIPSIALLFGIVPEFRNQFRSFGFWIFCSVSILITIPMIHWNIANNGIASSQLFYGGLLSSSFPPEGAYWKSVWSDWMFYAGPVWMGVVFLTVIAFFIWERKSTVACFLFYISVGLLGLQFLLFPKMLNSGLTGTAELSVLGMPFFLFVVYTWNKQLSGKLIMQPLLILILLLHGAWIFKIRQKPASWKDSAIAITEVCKAFKAASGEDVFLIASDQGIASLLSFYGKDIMPAFPGHPSVYIPESQNVQNQFSLWPRYDAFIEADKNNISVSEFFTEQKGINPFMDRSALFVTDADSSEPIQAIKSAFERWELLTTIRTDDSSRKVLRVFACYSYQTLPL